MTTFLSVLFVCISGECGFVNSKFNFYTLEECEQTTRTAIQELKENGYDPVHGGCLPMREDVKT